MHFKLLPQKIKGADENIDTIQSYHIQKSKRVKNRPYSDKLLKYIIRIKKLYEMYVFQR